MFSKSDVERDCGAYARPCTRPIRQLCSAACTGARSAQGPQWCPGALEVTFSFVVFDCQFLAQLASIRLLTWQPLSLSRHKFVPPPQRRGEAAALLHTHMHITYAYYICICILHMHTHMHVHKWMACVYRWQLVGLSQHKFASNVVEKLLQFSGPPTRQVSQKIHLHALHDKIPACPT